MARQPIQFGAAAFPNRHSGLFGGGAELFQPGIANSPGEPKLQGPTTSGGERFPDRMNAVEQIGHGQERARAVATSSRMASAAATGSVAAAIGRPITR